MHSSKLSYLSLHCWLRKSVTVLSTRSRCPKRFIFLRGSATHIPRISSSAYADSKSWTKLKSPPGYWVVKGCWVLANKFWILTSVLPPLSFSWSKAIQTRMPSKVSLYLFKYLWTVMAFLVEIWIEPNKCSRASINIVLVRFTVRWRDGWPITLSTPSSQ